MLKRLADLVDTYVVNREKELTLSAEASAHISVFSTILRSLGDIAPGLSAEAVSSLTTGLRSVEAAIQHVLDLRSDAVIGALLLAYSAALAPYVLLADVQSQ